MGILSRGAFRVFALGIVVLTAPNFGKDYSLALKATPLSPVRSFIYNLYSYMTLERF